MNEKYFICGNEVLYWQHEGKLYALKVRRDEHPDNPREWDGNLTTMACFHRRYDLGDKIGVKTEDDFYGYFRKLVNQHVTNKEFLTLCKGGKLSGLTVSENTDRKTVDVTFTGETPIKDVDSNRLMYEVIDDLTIEQCLQALQNHIEWLPLWLYDHSGITMSCGTRSGQYADRWDSSCVGFIIAGKKSIMEDACEILRDENGEPLLEEHVHENFPTTFSVATRPLTEETWRARAVEIMKEDVALYDQYLTGDVYYYTLYEADAVEGEDPDYENADWEETESCGGFYGDDLMTNGIADSVCCGLGEAIANDTIEKDSCIRFDNLPCMA